MVVPSMDWRQKQVHPEERQRVLDSMHTAIDRGENFWTSDYRFQRADGQYAMVTDRGVIDRDAGGRAVRMLGTIADVTERRRTDEKLSQAQRMEAVGRLAGGIAHDLNNMLTAIVGFSTLLDQDLDTGDRRRRDIAEIMKAADRSAALTRSLLAFARREIIHPQPLDLNRIVLEMGRMLRPAMGESVHVEMALEPIGGTVFADRARLEQVILNIALNARDAMPAGVRLSIATRSVQLGAGPTRSGPTMFSSTHSGP
jgi:signal transduction histidine kinase